MSTRVIVMIACAAVLLIMLNYALKYPSKDKGPRRLRIIISMTAAVIFAVCAFLEYTPRGANSLFDEAGRGENTGSDSSQTYTDAAVEDNVGNRIVVEIEIDKVKINGLKFTVTEDSDGGFGNYVNSEKLLGAEIIMVDTYATGCAYHSVKNTLMLAGARIVEERVK